MEDTLRNFDPDPKGQFPFDVPGYAFHLLVAISRIRDSQLEKMLKPIGVNVARHRALTIILRFGPCTMSELADFSSVDRTTLTRTVDQLVAEGYVNRRAAPKDRRQVLLTITPAGEAVAASARTIVARHNAQALEGVPDHLLRCMVEVERMIVANLNVNPDLIERLLTLERPKGQADPANDAS